MLKTDKNSGFTMVELAVAVSVVGILLAAAIPYIATTLQNSKIRSKANSFYTGLQVARTQAISRNQAVDFALISDPISGLSPAFTATATGNNWAVRAIDATNGNSILEAWQDPATTPTVSVSSTDPLLSFNGLGQSSTLVASGTVAIIQFTNPTGGACAPSGPMRCLNVRVAPGGQARICDPAVSAAGDSRLC